MPSKLRIRQGYTYFTGNDGWLQMGNFQVYGQVNKVRFLVDSEWQPFWPSLIAAFCWPSTRVAVCVSRRIFMMAYCLPSWERERGFVFCLASSRMLLSAFNSVYQATGQSDFWANKLPGVVPCKPNVNGLRPFEIKIHELNLERKWIGQILMECSGKFTKYKWSVYGLFHFRSPGK